MVGIEKYDLMALSGYMPHINIARVELVSAHAKRIQE